MAAGGALIRRLLLAILVVAAAIPIVPSRASASGDYEATAESSACGLPRFYTPRAEGVGAVSDGHLVRGPAGALFGRTLRAVEDDLVWWTVPMSDGARVQVHRLLLPSLRAVEDKLVEAALGGLHYQVRADVTSGYSGRTSVAHTGLSFHGLGAAIDINSDRNPYRLDGELITDMPEWFVHAWEEAGMCWGGGWRFAKDPMHFSWMGPSASPGFERLPPPQAPLTAPAPFRDPAGSHPVVFGPTSDRQFVADVSGDGGPDVVRIRPWGDHTVLEAATSRGGWAACSVWRWWLGDVPAGTPHLADLDGVGRPDLVYVDGSSGSLVLHRFGVMSGYRRAADVLTDVPWSDGRSVAFGDVDLDGADDLWIVEQGEGGVEVEVRSAASGFATILEAGTVPGVDLDDEYRLATADRTVDGRADLFLLEPSTSRATVVSPNDLDQAAETLTHLAIEASDAVGLVDYDGDGRPDLQTLSSQGTLDVRLGNTPLPGSATTWFLPSDFDCPDDTLPYHHDGPFADDDVSVFEMDIEWLAGRGITRGCNPPFEDWFCPDATVTRGQMAAFLVRGLDLPPGINRFIDDDGSVFEPDIAALAAAGITRGCDPPANDRFCPDDPVTRGQMAAFLHRAADWLPAS